MSHSLKTRLFSGLIIIVTVLLLYQIKILWLFTIIISIAMICELLIISKKFFEKKNNTTHMYYVYFIIYNTIYDVYNV